MELLEVGPEAAALGGAGPSFEELVLALHRPATYAGEVRLVEAIETHRSWVFLTEAHAYKLKKPLRAVPPDRLELGARRAACENELRLNLRLARDVYLAVVPIVRSDGQLRVEGGGAEVDWLLKMRRLPRERMLDACIARRDVPRRELNELVRSLSRFYGGAERAPLDGASYRRRIVADIEAKQASLEQARYGLSTADVRAVVEGQARWLARFGRVLERRGENVVDAHGDLRPEHVCLEPEPVVIDCLEFDRELRLLDPISELSFLALECRRLGAAWVGDRLLASYEQRARDPAPAPLVLFYESYHALVRAAVSIWHLDDGDLHRSDAWRQRSRAYLRMAERALASGD